MVIESQWINKVQSGMLWCRWQVECTVAKIGLVPFLPLIYTTNLSSSYIFRSKVGEGYYVLNTYHLGVQFCY
jgi:hypothetical protein